MPDLEEQITLLGRLRDQREGELRVRPLEVLRFIPENPLGIKLLEELFVQSFRMDLEPVDLMSLRSDSEVAAVRAVDEVVGMEDYSRVVWLVDRLPHAVTSVPDVQYGYAVALHRTGELQASLRIFRQLLRLLPQDSQLHYGIANAFRTGQNFRKAIFHYRRAIEIFPGYMAAYNNLGRTLNDSGDFAEAIQFLHSAIVIDPFDSAPYVNLGHSYLGLGLNKEAVDAYLASLELYEDSEEAINGLEQARNGTSA